MIAGVQRRRVDLQVGKRRQEDGGQKRVRDQICPPVQPHVRTPRREATQEVQDRKLNQHLVHNSDSFTINESR